MERLKIDSKVTNIKYKQMDKDPEIKKTLNNMERLILGNNGIWILEQLGLTPGKVQKALDDQWYNDVQQLLKEHNEYIFWESRKRSAVLLQNWMQEMKETQTEFTEEMMINGFQDSLKKAEIEVIQELVDKHL